MSEEPIGDRKGDLIRGLEARLLGKAPAEATRENSAYKAPRPILDVLLAVPEFPFGEGARALRRRVPRSGKKIALAVLQLFGLFLAAAALVLALVYVHVAVFSAKFLGMLGIGAAASARAIRDGIRARVYGARSEHRTVEIVPFRIGFQLVEPWGTREQYTVPATLLSATRTATGMHVRLRAKKNGEGFAVVDLEADETLLAKVLDALALTLPEGLRNEHPLGLPRIAEPNDLGPFLAAVNAVDALEAGGSGYRVATRDDAFLKRVAEDRALPEEERIGAILLLARRGRRHPSFQENRVRIGDDDSSLVRIAAEETAEETVLFAELRRALVQDP